MKIQKRFLALLLMVALFITLVSCNKNNSDGLDSPDDQSAQDVYPKISYLPHNCTLLNDRWVSVRYSTVEELHSAMQLLADNGVEIPEKKRAAFDFISDKYVVKYWFDGILTEASAKEAGAKDYYELEYDFTTVESYLYYNVSSVDELPESARYLMITGPHSDVYPQNMFGFAFARISAVENAVIPENIDTEKLVLGASEYEVLSSGLSDIGIYTSYVSYEGVNIVRIDSHEPLTDEIFEELKSTLIFY